MSGHRRVKNVGYEDDDLDEYDEYEDYEDNNAGGAANEGADDMTDEDREQLQQGTIKVRAALGDSAQISDHAIQEALWHYWFDVDKTVVFLKNKHQPQSQPKQAKAVSRFDQAAAASAVKAETELAPGSAGKTNSSKKKDNNGTARVAKAVDDLSIDDPPSPTRDRPRVAAKIQSKNLDVIQEYHKAQGKKELNFVVVGHIDHGKSTLMGRLLYEHKVIDQRSLDKFRKEAAKLGKESFALAWIMDAREDEREHGVTIDYAEKNFETDKAMFTILDAPGHRDFVGNMIAGTSMADLALLVIDAGTNASEAGLKGQTREHAQVVRCMKLEKLIVAVNKMDTVAWSQDSFNSAVQKVSAVLQELLFDPSNLVFVPCSGLTGDNITSAPSQQAPWYTGPTLVQALETVTPNRSQYLGALTDPFRLRISGFAGLSDYSEFATSNAHEPFTVFGRLDAGTVQVGDQLVTQPGGETAIVKGITRHGATAPWAVAGHIVGLQLTDCDEERFAKGDLLCAAARPARCIAAATLKLLAFDTVFPMPVDVHRGRLRVPARITALVAQLDPKTHAVVKDAPKVVRHGDVARVRVEFDERVPLERRSRVVLRYGGETIAAGAVERGL